jgi:hypothetical protein
MARDHEFIVSSEPEIPLPDSYNGSRTVSSASNFKEAMELVFVLQPRRFPSVNIKLAYVTAFLKYSALAWIKYIRQNEDCTTMDSFWTAFWLDSETSTLRKKWKQTAIALLLITPIIFVLWRTSFRNMAKKPS